MHLGMSGRFEIAGAHAARGPGDFALAQPPDPKHAHIVFETEAGAAVTYYDPRRFGYMDLIATDALERHPWFAGLGPEPLGCGFDAAHLAARLRRAQGSRSRHLLLDQRIVAGLGNIYVCEALHRAGVAPRAAGRRPCRRASWRRSPRRSARCWPRRSRPAARRLRDYAGADGSLGYFQHRFAVYGREGEPCLKPGCRGQVERIVQAGRSTFACNRCQR